MRSRDVAAPEALVHHGMQTLIETFGSLFGKFEETFKIPPIHYVLVTGAAGSLGAHVVSQLTARQYVCKVYCLVRTHSDGHTTERLIKSLQARNITANTANVRAFASEISHPHLELSEKAYKEIAKCLHCVIHCGWHVDYNLSPESSECCIKGTRHLIDLCLHARMISPADSIFCSSVSAVATIPGTEVPEEWANSLDVAQGIGYAQSKLVAEHICLKASQATELFARVLRIGQIVGDTKSGIWNREEVLPMMLQSAVTMGAVPKLDEKPQLATSGYSRSSRGGGSIRPRRDSYIPHRQPQNIPMDEKLACNLTLYVRETGSRD